MFRKVFSATVVVLVRLRRHGFFIAKYVQGHPQCRRKLMIVGLPSCAGMVSLGVEGAFWPTAGTSAVCTVGGDIHDDNSVCQVIVKRCEVLDEDAQSRGIHGETS